MPLVELRNVTKSYFQGELEVKVLKGISLSVERGEFVAIMGPSGSGKSTLMYILGCLDRPTSGEYYLDGKNVLELSDDELSQLRSRYIGFVFQAFYLVPYLSVLDNVMLPVEYLDSKYRRELFSKTTPERRAREILERLGLSERLHFKPDQLSGGQKQRVAIARALINSPEIILADEPTGQLDSESGKAVMELLTELNKEGKTVIVVTHDKAVASYAKRIVRIKDGQIVE
ncbi:ABC transporter ATP-binding protein [Phorcysia thermohydrogeniphila]|uniref:Putative ABC transport system ATP-binding protein n=1 Tax=Phorcysia thermohydrogeniphila TaxID=936138 RepID=A0A4R1GEN6_9BACT|nr:ABC transporter ATP-binding protein [Phorcysia thermohydrogeniphila]TCK05281.1 putative ABC transport system ATP-binding protein [Phorcysia thermohydrogeniphila]